MAEEEGKEISAPTGKESAWSLLWFALKKDHLEHFNTLATTLGIFAGLFFFFWLDFPGRIHDLRELEKPRYQMIISSTATPFHAAEGNFQRLAIELKFNGLSSHRTYIEAVCLNLDYGKLDSTKLKEMPTSNFGSVPIQYPASGHSKILLYSYYKLRPEVEVEESIARAKEKCPDARFVEGFDFLALDGQFEATKEFAAYLRNDEVTPIHIEATSYTPENLAGDDEFRPIVSGTTFLLNPATADK